MKKLTVDKKDLKKGAAVAGGIALVAAVSAVCIKGLKAVDRKMKAKREAELYAKEEPVVETPVEEEIVTEEAAEEEQPAE